MSSYEIGSIYLNNVGEEMEVVGRTDDGYIVVEFQDDHRYRKKVHYANLKKWKSKESIL